MRSQCFGTVLAWVLAMLAYEDMDVYRLAVEVNRWFGGASFPRGRSHLREQGVRAMDSVVCNIAEGLSKQGPSRRRALDIAAGEAGEANAVLDCVALAGGAEQQGKLRRIGAMVAKLSR